MIDHYAPPHHDAFAFPSVRQSIGRGKADPGIDPIVDLRMEKAKRTVKAKANTQPKSNLNGEKIRFDEKGNPLKKKKTRPTPGETSSSSNPIVLQSTPSQEWFEFIIHERQKNTRPKVCMLESNHLQYLQWAMLERPTNINTATSSAATKQTNVAANRSSKHLGESENKFEVETCKEGKLEQVSIRKNILDSMTSFRQRSQRRMWELRGKDAAIHRAFDKLDLDGNDTLDRFEISKVMEEATKKLKLDMEVGVIGVAVDALLDDANSTNGPETPCMTRSQFVNLFRRHPDMLHAFDDESTMASLQDSSLLKIEEADAQFLDEDEENHQVREFARTQWRNKRVALLWLCMYTAANIAAFAQTAVRYAHNEEAQAVFGSCITVARASAKCLNLNAFLILLPMCRHLVTRMRAFGKLRLWFPFDATLEYHMIVGVVMAAFTVAHVGAHMCDFTRFAEADVQDIFALVGTKLGETIPESKAGRWMLLLKQPAGITGVIMLLCTGVAYATIRARRKNFNTFWITHHLFLVMLICLCFHGVGGLLEPFQSVYWVAGPLLLYLLPKLFRQTKYAQCQVLDIAIKGGNVVGLKLAKPASWNKHVKAGMYAFINVPKVSSIEWHPFTLTSAPHDDFIEFHFAQVGDWTKSVNSLLQGAVMHHGTAASRDGGGYDIPSMHDLVVKVEGPIGASSQGFSHYPVLVLIGAGIGVTPMISVLKQLLKEPGKMKRTYLYWTVRDRASFEWFNTLMDDIYENSDEQRDRLQIRHFLTSVKDDVRDVGTVLLHHASRAKHKQTDFDFLLGRRTRHQVDIGRPNWGDELSSVRSDSKELGCRKCGVFLCGPQRMAQEVAQVSFKLSVEDPDFHFQFTEETF